MQHELNVVLTDTVNQVNEFLATPRSSSHVKTHERFLRTKNISFDF